MEYPVAFVNAFANGLFDGNTAAVVVVNSYPSDKKMLDTARLFGFSETAFLQSLDSGAYQIRWFTPEVEVPLCGHATLASAAYLFAEREKDNQQLRFISLSGELVARKNNQEVELDFPLDIPHPYQAEPEVITALGKIKILQTLYAPFTHNLIVVVDNPETVLSTEPDFTGLLQLRDKPYFGIAVTAADIDGYVCRYFAPWEGINEDPVTGSAQTFLAPFWAEAMGKAELNGFQASSRGGHFSVSVLKDRILIRGKAYIYLNGLITIP
ncbi:PhzF family phenazine biosynthesis protein [Candidatus Cloacimonadaceae bacterium]